MRTYFRPFWSSVVWRRIACLVLVIALLVMGTFLVRSGTHAAGTQTAIPRPSHVVIVVEENESADDIIGSSDVPYINSLAQQGAVFTNASGVSHPSQPNYLALFSGSTHGLSSNYVRIPSPALIWGAS